MKNPGIIAGDVRPIIMEVKPEISGGRYPIKRVVGDPIRVEATIVLDGHDLLSAELLYRRKTEREWARLEMTPHPKQKDVWEASFLPTEPGDYLYTVQARVDRFETWRSELIKRYEGGQELAIEFQVGAELVAGAIRRAKGKPNAKTREALERFHRKLLNAKSAPAKRVKLSHSTELQKLMVRFPDPTRVARFEKELEVTAERERAAFSAWYEFFPRSASLDGTRHGTFKDCEKLLPYVRKMGFDVVYLPPIHPIGGTNRKGRNNSLTATPKDPGSPWGIGAASGGHKSVHPELGTLADFRRFEKAARKHGMELALDLAFQCAPDHPYVKEHPEWFRRLPDGSVRFAENPPKKYQDIYPFDFESRDWRALWAELLDVVFFWIRQGVRIFRVDNPHTKSFRFWEWLIAAVRRKHPDVIFLSEAFTRPALMYGLARLGFTQSYTYFTWRNTPAEFKKYLEELTETEVAQYYRPNFWPNTPDILPEHLQKGGRPAFVVRVALAATLSSNYGIYGPAYELCDHEPLKEGGEEYLNSEKYELKAWDLDSPDSIRDFIARLNHIRSENRALQRTPGVRFIPTGSDQVLAYVRFSEDRRNLVLVVANLDFKNPHTAVLQWKPEDKLTAQDLLRGNKTRWIGSLPSFTLDPEKNPVEIFRLSAGAALP